MGSLWAASSSNRFLGSQLLFFSEKRFRCQEEVSAGPSYRCGLKNEVPNRAKNENRARLTAAVQTRAKAPSGAPGCPRSSLRALLDAVDERERAERIDRAETG